MRAKRSVTHQRAAADEARHIIAAIEPHGHGKAPNRAAPRLPSKFVYRLLGRSH